ncbi:MAG: polysaccharide deacetylase family protein [Verrucomicrobiales bacterium]
MRLSLSLSDAPNKTAAHGAICEALKAIPQEDLYADVERVEQRLGAALANDPNPAAIYRPLSWDQAREMQASGLIAIGAHTHHHRILGRCAAETARAEMTESLGILEHRLGSRPALFAYPNGKPGDHTAETRALLGDLGITAAVTTEQAFAGPDADPLAIPRFGHTPDPRYMDALASGTLQFVKSAIRPLRRRAA